MGVIRFLASRLASRTVKSIAKSVAIRELDKLAAKRITGEFLKQLLTDCIRDAQAHTGVDGDFSPRHMAANRGASGYTEGWVTSVQNFDELRSAKASKDDQFVRFIFRAVQRADDPSQPYLEVLVWHPSHGHAEDMKFVFQSEADSGRDMFVQLLATAMHICTAPSA